MRASALLWMACLAWTSSVSGDEAGDRFRDRVAPILEGHCLRCHQGVKPKGDFNLSEPSGVIEGRGPRQVVVPGRPEESRLFEVISGAKPTMPKSGDRLDAGQVEAIRAWIAEGAPWPEGLILKADPLAWWSLRPLVRPTFPRSKTIRPRTPIDAFVLGRV